MQQYPNVEDYTTAIKMIDVSDVSNSGGSKDETKKKLKNGAEIGMSHYTIYTDLDVKEDNFVRAIQNEDHEDNIICVGLTLSLTITKIRWRVKTNGRAREWQKKKNWPNEC